ncbi:hypothetical protein Pelo_3092 [Pelomyxa schiedti]|nr:hypothetical protein Pelo_3092 [Pelomyxa schiedti]
MPFELIKGYAAFLGSAFEAFITLTAIICCQDTHSSSFLLWLLEKKERIYCWWYSTASNIFESSFFCLEYIYFLRSCATTSTVTLLFKNDLLSKVLFGISCGIGSGRSCTSKVSVSETKCITLPGFTDLSAAPGVAHSQSSELFICYVMAKCSL